MVRDKVKVKVKTATVSEALRLASGHRAIPGTITAVSQVYHMIKGATVKCNICKYEGELDYDPPINYSDFRRRRPKSCATDKCEGLLYSTPKNIPAITIEIRNPDSANDLEVIKAVLFDKNTKDVIVGENVVILGDIAVTENKDKGYSVIYAKKMKYENPKEIKLSVDDAIAIERFAESKNNHKELVKELVSMVAPSVIGHEDKKEGILLSAVMTPEDKPRRKTRAHILFIGTPGVAKTELLHGAADLVPGSSVQSGQGSTGLSLTAMVVKEEDTTMLKIGPIPRARGKICCINEINKQNYTDQDKILDFMQEGQSNINKFGHSAPIRGPTTIIASANPVHGDFTLLDNGKIDVKEVTIMSALWYRFDLTFVFKAENDHSKLLEYADKKGRLLNQDEVPICSPFIVKYIMHAKKISPKLSEEAMSILNHCYADLAYRNRVSPRRLETLYNLAIARAKLKIKETVDIEDASETVEFYNKVIEDYHTSIAVADNPRDVAASKIQELLEQNSKNELTSGPMTFTDLIANACERDQQVKLYIGGDLSMRSNYKLRPIAQLVESNPRIKRTKTKPLMLNGFSLPVSVSM
jgi:replicative DNA helicase Mcm